MAAHHRIILPTSAPGHAPPCVSGPLVRPRSTRQIGEAFGQAAAFGALVVAVPVALLAGLASFVAVRDPLVPGFKLADIARPIT